LRTRKPIAVAETEAKTPRNEIPRQRPEKKLPPKKINGGKKFGEPKFEKKASVVFYRAGKNDAIDLSPAGTLIFKLYLFKTVSIAVTVPDIKLNIRLEKFKSTINPSRKSEIFEITAAKTTAKTENEKINPINYVGYKAGI